MRLWLAAWLCAVAFAAEPVPLLVAAGPEAAAWAAPAAARGWAVVQVDDAPVGDAGVRAIEVTADAARKQRDADPMRTYLAGPAGPVLYTISRRPDLWAGAVIAGGNPNAAIETNRLFGANAQLIPILWPVPQEERETLQRVRDRLSGAGFDIQMRTAAVTMAQALDWLQAKRRDAHPNKVDCETGNPAFARCYWVEISRFDPAQRNDALGRSRVAPGSGAYLNLGGFGFQVNAPGPGVVVSWLPANYSGPLKPGDRIISLGGRPIQDAREYVQTMSSTFEEKPAAVMVERGKQKLRIETRIMLPRREETVTARIAAEYSPDPKQIYVITRGAGEVRLTLPQFWTPVALNWNGNDAGQAGAAGCWLLSGAAPARQCP